MSHPGTQRKPVRLVTTSARSQNAQEQAIVEEIGSIFTAARMMESINVADYVAGAEVQSLGGDLEQVKSGIRAVEALISVGNDRDQWFAMLEMLAQKIDTITERLAIGVRRVRSA